MHVWINYYTNSKNYFIKAPARRHVFNNDLCIKYGNNNLIYPKYTINNKQNQLFYTYYRHFVSINPVSLQNWKLIAKLKKIPLLGGIYIKKYTHIDRLVLVFYILVASKV